MSDTGQLSRYDAVVYAHLIASSYATEANHSYSRPLLLLPQASQPSKSLTHEDIVWAWNEYRDETKAVSIASLSAVLNCRKASLQYFLKHNFGVAYQAISYRRKSGGDLFLRHYHKTLQAGCSSKC